MDSLGLYHLFWEIVALNIEVLNGGLVHKLPNRKHKPLTNWVPKVKAKIVDKGTRTGVIIDHAPVGSEGSERVALNIEVLNGGLVHKLPNRKHKPLTNWVPKVKAKIVDKGTRTGVIIDHAPVGSEGSERVALNIEVLNGGLVHKLPNRKHKPLTNWVPKVKAKIVDKGTRTGVIIDHAPVGSEGSERYTTFISMKKVSKQSDIVNALSYKENLFTREYYQSKENYLPDYLYALIETANQDPTIPIVEPVRDCGIQSWDGRSSIWVFPHSEFTLITLRVDDEGVTRVNPEDVGLGFTTTKFYTKQLLSIREFTNANFDPAKLVLERVRRDYFSINSPPFFATLGAMAYAINIKRFNSPMDHPFVPVVIGGAGSGKSTAVQLIFSIVGITKSIILPTESGLDEELSKSSAPVWWEDVEDRNTAFESTTMWVYDKSAKKKKNSHEMANTVPICTSNGLFFKDYEGVRLKRLLERIIVIPYKKNPQFGNFNDSYEFNQTIAEFVGLAQALLPILLKIDFHEQQYRALASSVLEDFPEIHQSRDIHNYGLLLNSMAMVMDNLEMSIEDITETSHQFVRDFLIPFITPFHQRYEVKENTTDRNKLHRLLTQAIKPETRHLIIVSKTVGCTCGDAVGLPLTQINRLTTIPVDQIRNFVVKNGLGCSGKKINLTNNNGRIQYHGIHVRKNFVSQELLDIIEGNVQQDDKANEANDDQDEANNDKANEANDDKANGANDDKANEANDDKANEANDDKANEANDDQDEANDD
ncbi:uncharacterized protein [Clytia hemisphaerica]|uniref:uncharacterized protein isoform X2 n=1 Tax=Clytia hemisphaerica TaxID=252671 RepID=UPI0034D7721D